MKTKIRNVEMCNNLGHLARPYWDCVSELSEIYFFSDINDYNHRGVNTDSLVAASEMNNNMMYPNCSALEIPSYVGPNEVREDLL